MTGRKTFLVCIIDNQMDDFRVLISPAEDTKEDADIFDALRALYTIAEENRCFLASCNCGCEGLLYIDESEVKNVTIFDEEKNRSISVDWETTTRANMTMITGEKIEDDF